tara:strand:+ start:651 stop:1043 length:393 start_codon:yes stop_codon:yes gene_type:complete
MFKWFKKKSKQQEAETLLNGHQFIIFTVDKDGVINMDFDFDSDEVSNEMFSEMFHQIHNGDLIETSVSFIEERLEEKGRSSDYSNFEENIRILNTIKNDPLTEILSSVQSDEVVVKPTDIAKTVLKGQGE